MLISFCGKQRIVLTVDKAIFEGYEVPKNFEQFVNDEVDALLNSTGHDWVAQQV